MRRLLALATALTALAAAAPASAATFFHSPSGNIRCVIDATSFTRCDITNRDWSPPPKPRTCEFDWRNSMGLGFRGRLAGRRGRALPVAWRRARGLARHTGKLPARAVSRLHATARVHDADQPK